MDSFFTGVWSIFSVDVEAQTELISRCNVKDDCENAVYIQLIIQQHVKKAFRLSSWNYNNNSLCEHPDKNRFRIY